MIELNLKLLQLLNAVLDTHNKKEKEKILCFGRNPKKNINSITEYK